MKDKQSKNKFSFYKRIVSFKYAFRGIFYLLKTQHNAWIHLLATFVVVTGGIYFSLDTTEWILLTLTIGVVFAAEAFNTAIELLVDKVSPEHNKTAGMIKDLAAGAVLIIAIVAVIIGILIFGSKMFW